MRNVDTARTSLGALALLASLMLLPGCSSQRTFSSPDQAVTSLVDALRAGDDKQLKAVLGSSEKSVLSSGDDIADQDNLQKFLTAYDMKHSLASVDEGETTLIVGPNDWPMPIPIVKASNKDQWRFDLHAGKEEIVNRRVGRNELDTIQVCLAIVDAQREYALADPDHDGVPAYAQKFLSDPGTKNGLYWPTAENEKPSPLGELVATAAEQGYSAPAKESGPQPYRGYCYRMLTAQGPHASGGARDYMVRNQMLSGFAVVAYPVEHGKSGVMTFIVNQDGNVYQRDLGSDTKKIATSMKTFDPDEHWKKVEPPAPEKP